MGSAGFILLLVWGVYASRSESEEAQDVIQGPPSASFPFSFAEPECISDSRWKRECNWCRCVRGRAACSKRRCFPEDQLADVGQPICADGSRWKDKCGNWCSCSNGQAICTEKGCAEEVARPVLGGPNAGQLGRPQRALNIDCTSGALGSRWRNECNWCKCTDAGLGACTKRLCPPDFAMRTVNEPECEGKVSWKKNCNWCNCENGMAVCSDHNCDAATEGESSECADGASWMRDCNICHCRSGKAFCSKRLCTSDEGETETTTTPQERAGEKEPQCKEGSRWLKECNWCTCTNDIGVCTTLACLPDYEKSIEKECEEGSSWKVDCNSCNCAEGKQVCTKQMCPPKATSSVGLVAPLAAVAPMLTRTAQVAPDAICTEGSRWRVDCNWCSCANGRALCTLKGCFPGVPPSNEKMCEEGSRWKADNCNWCSCSNGAGVCTQMACLPANALVKAPFVCTSGSRWRDACNWCICTKNAPACTEMACSSDFKSDEKECEDGARWMKECNLCQCSKGIAVCTLKECLPKEVTVSPAVTEKVCDEGSRWRVDCNWCTCTNGIGVCTKVACLLGVVKSDEKMCEEGSRWKIDCNWCTCSNGIGMCTKRGCLLREKEPPVTTTTELEDKCSNGSKWKEDCNWCSCLNGVARCTKRACPPRQSTEVEKTCEEGSRWRQECNWCHCANGVGVCTAMGCAPPRPHAPLPAYFDEKECEEGSHWKKGCNWCRCTKEKAICTKKMCFEGSQHMFTNEDKKCEDGTKWKEDCNLCRCSNGVGVCTMMACQKDEAKKKSDCTDGSRWKKECNDCHCVNGIGVCTLRGCVSGRPQKQPEITSQPSVKMIEPQCTDGSHWRSDCNWCTCKEGIPLCTKMGCMPESTSSTPKDEPECLDGSMWKNDCNWCRCKEGKSVCTKIFCFQDTPESKKCTEDEEWQDGCYNCICINGEATCTDCPLEQVHDLCSLPAVEPNAASCGKFDVMWSFSSESKSCEKVVYGGCGGTANLFATEEDCQGVCATLVRPDALSKSLREERCLQTPDPGPCFANKQRYAFIVERNRCEKFNFGGCQGNSNNFMTASECFQACGGDPPTDDPSCDRSKCFWQRYAHYESKHCRPQYEGGSCCPTSFDCPSATLRHDKCQYKGKEYEIDQEVPVDDPCSRACRCVTNFETGNPARMECADVECPSLFNPPVPNCRLLYRSGDCCEYDKLCSDPNTPPHLQERGVACTWDNKTYPEGSRIYFKEEACQQCVCSAEFSGPYGPGCSKVQCGLDFRYAPEFAKGCVPMFFEKKCCHIGMLCPGDPIIIYQKGISPAFGKAGTCRFGNITVEVGQSVETNDCSLKCNCETPPELTCVKHRKCQTQEEEEKREKECGGPVKCAYGCKKRLNPSTNCYECACKGELFSCPAITCPPMCLNPFLVFDTKTGCMKCNCDCRKDLFTGKPPCPMDCAIQYRHDEETGCEVCECDTSPGAPVWRGR